LNRNTINTDVEKIQTLYRERGFFGLVSESRQLENGTVLYVVREATVSRVDITGLKKTRESLVRRMIRIQRGETYSAVRARQDLNRIYDMGFFEPPSFRVADDPDAPGSVIVTFVLQEKRTGQLSLGAGFDNRSRITGFASIGESNFRGTGNRIGASVEVGGRRSFELSFGDPLLAAITPASTSPSSTAPRSVNRALSKRFSDQHQRHHQQEHQHLRPQVARTIGIETFAPITKSAVAAYVPITHSHWTRIARVTSSSVCATKAPISSVLEGETDSPLRHHRRAERHSHPQRKRPGQEGGSRSAQRAAFSRRPSVFLRDKRDIRLEPSRGGREQIILEKSFSFLGGTTDFTKVDVDLRRYVPLIGAARPEDLPRLVLAGRAVFGRSFGELPAFEQYFIGGPDTVRGYETDVRFGDNQFYTNLELRYRFNRQFQFVGFADAGAASGGRFESGKTGLLSSVGVGIRVRTPIGPIRLDLAKPLQGGDGFKTHFAIGPTF
jgi:outer membrane protein insertion porin family